MELRKKIKETIAWAQSLDEELKQKNEFIDSQNARLLEVTTWAQGLDKELKEKNRHIEHLLEQERTLNNILASRGWKFLKQLYKFRDFILPLNSKRRLFIKIALKAIKNPKEFIKSIKLTNLKKVFRYLRTNNIEGLENKIETYFQVNKFELQIFPTNDTTMKLTFEHVEKPLVSIIIPVYNLWRYTYSCLRSILEHTQNVSYEIIIADDVSSDDTVNISEYVENVIVIRNETNLGFLLNCNNAAKHASGKYILFLNNDTNVQKDWLKHLVDLIENDETIGMVGSKLVYPDGRQQEAGGVIWKDASGWNYGRLDDPEKPEYNYVKEVDYISGASIMIRSSLWRAIGGFDERYIPAYFEDSDLAFEVRKRGYKVVFQPKSVVVHFEGISHGTDVSSGIKSYQVKNKDKFIEKWKDVLETEHFDNGQEVYWARDRSRNKKTILVIDHYVPHYDKDAGSRTTFQYLKLFIEMGLNVKFLGDNFFKHEPYTSEIQQLGIEVLYGSWYARNIKEWIKENGRYIDYTYLNRPHISTKYIDMVKQHTKSKVIYYGHDLHYLRLLREYELSKDNKVLESSEHWKQIELDLFNKSDVVYYPSQVEVDEITKHNPHIISRAIPAYVYETFDDKVAPQNGTKDLLFVGGFAHKPNIDAVLWFVKEIFPMVLASIPEIKFYIIGSNPPDEIKALQSEHIIVTGFVTDEELMGYYKACRLAVVPLRYGAGIKGKVVEAMYHQIPVVTTSIGAEGLFEVTNVLAIADTASTFADTIIRLYNEFKLLEQMSANSLKYVKERFSKESALKIILYDLKP